MDDTVAVRDEHHPQPPRRLFERLRQIAGYTWDESRQPLPSSYGNWQVFGLRNSIPSPPSKPAAEPTSPQHRTTRVRAHSTAHSEASSGGHNHRDEGPRKESLRVIARASTHILREERAYYICKNLTRTEDPEGNHVIRPVDTVRLANGQEDENALVVCIFEDPGPNYLATAIDCGPAWHTFHSRVDGPDIRRDETSTADEPVSLQRFLDFAVGASECLEMLHHGQQIVHGEIRGDAFHMNIETGKVKVMNFGSGLRSFENGLTSMGWSMLSKEVFFKTKLSYMSPEQTGRMPTEPDSRTDIFSLGILLWTMLTKQPAFKGETPMDIIRAVLGRKLPSVSAIRLDIPDVIGRIIQKATAKTIGERYHSASGLKYDLVEVRRLLGAGDSAALEHWQIATKDISASFILPTVMMGRAAEHDEIVKMIDNVSKRHAGNKNRNFQSISSTSSISEGRAAVFDTAVAAGEALSETDNASSTEGRRSSYHTIDVTVVEESRKIKTNSSDTASTEKFRHDSVDSLDSHKVISNLKSERQGSLSPDLGSLLESFNGEGGGGKSGSDRIGSLMARRNTTRKFRKNGRCEVVTIAGSAGLGKSCLVQSVQVEARRRGYFASSKFDQAEKKPFGPVLKLLSSLFKQVFSESSMDSTFHKALKQYVRPAWPMLHKVLELPEFLLGNQAALQVPSHSLQLRHGYNRSVWADVPGHPSSPTSSHGSLYSTPLAGTSSHDSLATGSNDSVPIVNTFLDVLRVFTNYKFICFCLEDLQYADDESLDLITQIVSSKMTLVLIVTYRPDEILQEKIRNTLQPLESDAPVPDAEFSPTPGYAERSGDQVQSRNAGITRVILQPLSRDDVERYVTATLPRAKPDLGSLIAFIQSKTAGNPFYVREMLDTCHRKHCIWYDYRESGWCFDLDRIFEQFDTDGNTNILNNDFVTSRLNELPASSRSILAWASLLGTSFSFELVQRLLSGEFESSEQSCCWEGDAVFPLSHSEQDAIEGLQAAIQACIIITTEDDDIFRFAHDRYIQAATSLRECNKPTMHFIIAQTLLKYYSVDDKWRDTTASHICESIEIINSRVAHRQSFRTLLFDSAQKAAESGARSTAAKFYANCFALLQDDPWDNRTEDAYYDETLQLYTKAAECFLYMGQYEDARGLLLTVSINAKTPIDKAPAWVLQSRVYAQEGNSTAAFQALRRSLAALDIEVDDNPTFEKCDAEFKRLSQEIQLIDNLADKPISKDSNFTAVGAVLVETLGAAFWSDTLTFYQMSLVMVNTHLTSGSFPQAGIGFLHLAMISITRFNMIKFATEMGDIALALMDRWRDPYTMGRGGTIYSTFVGHIQYPLTTFTSQLEGALEYAIQAGDRISTILNFGLVGNLKFFASEHLAELESFCTYGCEEVPNWQLDTPGGTMVIAIRQVCRALQGKSYTGNPLKIMSDERHDSLRYKSWLKGTMKNSDRPLLLYESIEIAPLFLYGHYTTAIDLGSSCLKKIDAVWSARNARFVMFFQGLSLAGSVWRKLEDVNRPLYHSEQASVHSTDNIRVSKEEFQEEIMGVAMMIKYLQRRIEHWQAVTDVNYLAWSKLLAAQIAEMRDDHGQALRLYAEALDHASVHGFVFEEAIGNYLLAGLFIRTGSRRQARMALREAIMLYRQFGATGVARYVEEEYSLLLQDPVRKSGVADAGVQTDLPGMDKNEESQRVQAMMADTNSGRVGEWQGSSSRPDDAGLALPSLHMIDLASILESSQVISSVLQVDQLLAVMCEIILQNCEGLASFVAILVEESGIAGWSIAASGDPDGGARAHIPGLPLGETTLVAEGVVLYCMRFREVVSLPDLVHDQRFAKASEAWIARNPNGKSVIAMPICHGDDRPLLGVLYLEGQPNAFTDRNLTVLQLLVNQIGISYSNALTLKEVEKMSAINNSMVDVQRRALAKALTAEENANRAKAEALRSVQLAEEASKAKSIFLANISHELRTPLYGVIGNSELLIDSNLRPDQAEMADSIRVSADLLLTVINDILDFSKMEANKMRLNNVAFDAHEMIRDVVRSIPSNHANKKKSKNIAIVQDIQMTPSLIYGDPIRLHQVLGNLIGNSLKFTEHGSITIGAKTDMESADGVKLTFWVKDTGIGISRQQLSKLFKPFSQADVSTARKYGGSGLGLSICKALVESMMGGTIQLESSEGQGTTVSFSVTFPRARPDTPTGHIAHESDQRTPPYIDTADDKSRTPYNDLSHIPRSDLRICIAEDNPINQKIAIQFVERLGFPSVAAYENGLLAVESLRRRAREGKPYHIILMDIQMPILDGYEATKLIRNDASEAVRGVLIIAMTASAILGDREKCLEAGMNDYLAKPVKLAVLRKKLGQYLPEVS